MSEDKKLTAFFPLPRAIAARRNMSPGAKLWFACYPSLATIANDPGVSQDRSAPISAVSRSGRLDPNQAQVPQQSADQQRLPDYQALTGEGE